MSSFIFKYSTNNWMIEDHNDENVTNKNETMM